MSFIADGPVLYQLLRGRKRGVDPAASLESFYRGQAGSYDRFREGLLHGREELLRVLLDQLPVNGGRLVELGAGTARTLEFDPVRISRLGSVAAVDLCPSLLAVARQRFIRLGWDHARIAEGDATAWGATGSVDGVLCSYSLSMIPDWTAVLDNAWRILRPGGCIGVVDFHLPRDARGIARWFWPRWFRHDGVHLRTDLVERIFERFDLVYCQRGLGRVPYVPGRIWHARVVARKR